MAGCGQEINQLLIGQDSIQQLPRLRGHPMSVLGEPMPVALECGREFPPPDMVIGDLSPLT
ncbi:conserved hypothetical protein [Ricinus communis]|uniref:Uncharacterized protein n=1 Tax=Ricinus communis TaxID=3988 RepID=B9REK4_RICCO|nr:conserved hypothetical protein [Ricinus communis]